MLTYLLILIIGALAGFAAGVASFGFAIVNMLLLPFVLGIKAATLVTLMSSFTLYIFILYQAFVKEKVSFSMKLILMPITGSIIGRWIGAMVYIHMTPEMLMLSLSVFMVFINLWFFRWADKVTVRPTLAAGLGTGLLSGFFGGLNNVTGPPMVAYLHAVEKDPLRYTAHLQLIFMIGAIASLMVHILNGSVTRQITIYSGVGLIGVAFGTALGYWMYRKIDRRISVMIIRYFILFSSIVLITKTTLSYFK